MQRIILGLGMIAVVAGLSLGASGAFFNDTETSLGNTFAAGALDLKIDNTSYGFDWNDPEATNPQGVWGPNPFNSWQLSDLTDQLFFSFIDLKPGDYGEDTISLHVQNDAWACMAFRLTGTPENDQTEPEADVDNSAGVNEGELQNYLSFIFWNDDGDNVLEDDETVIEALSGLPGSAFTGQWLPIAEGGDTPLHAEDINYLGKGWCFGEMTATPVTQDNASSTPPSAPDRIGFTCNGSGNHNDAQTDGIVVDVGFYAEQSRNNPNFLCSSLPPISTPPPVDEATIVVNENDLFVPENLEIDNRPSAFLSGGWFFYNDTNDTIMSLNQFASDGANEFVTGPDTTGSAFMRLHDASARYNIATYQFASTSLASISSLRYRIYDESASSETPYLHFNVSYDGSDTWQGRLVQVPTGVVVDTWTTVDALASTWTKTSGNWPAGSVSDGSILGSTARTWAEILADYPSASIRATDSFFGIRVGHPGPASEESYVDWVEFDGITYDFEN